MKRKTEEIDTGSNKMIRHIIGNIAVLGCCVTCIEAFLISTVVAMLHGQEETKMWMLIAIFLSAGLLTLFFASAAFIFLPQDNTIPG